MRIDILTLFPEMFKGPFDESIVKRARNKKLVEIKIHNIRKWADDKRGTVDDRPYGGGVGMIMMVEPIYKALKALRQGKDRETWVVLLSPRGTVFTQKIAHNLSRQKQLIFICGHYEGVDERVRELVNEEISIGDYVLTGGELPAMIMADTIVRLIPGVLEKAEATKHDSFSPILEYPQYTRPEIFKDWPVPKILLSGDHKKMDEWRKKESLKITKKRRPDLL
jgi:tRNA (guanine37-N1)-methyltransferase